MKFSDIKGKPRLRGSGCALCGEPNTGVVVTGLRELGSTGSTKGGRHVRSKSVSMCETHAVSIYLAMEESLLRAVGREDLIEA